MLCRHCGKEMEPGIVSSPAGPLLWFTSEEEKKKTGLMGYLDRKTLDLESVRCYQAWHCRDCQKVVAELDVKSNSYLYGK